MKYKPLLGIEAVDVDDPEERASLQASIREHEYTHVQDTNGNVWWLGGRVNKKSVALDDTRGDDTPPRVKFTEVATFGVMDGTTRATPEKNPDETAETPGQEQRAAPAHHERAHALLSASSANRWLHCTPAPTLEAQYPDSTSTAAEEGTAAHELAEHKLRLLTGQPTIRPESTWHSEEMEEHTDEYADQVMAELAQAQEASPAAYLAIEQRLDFSHIVPNGFGTGDALIVGDGTMTVIDFKYGKGVPVSAAGNPQMMLYALGALAQFGLFYDIQQVRMVIFQPRLGNTSIDEVTVGELSAWADEVVKPAAEKAAKGEGQLTAGEWCRFCRHAPQCPALAAEHFAPVPTTGDNLTPAAPEPDTLTDEQISRIVTHSGELKKWLSKVESFALGRATGGHDYPGLKVVEGRSVRRYQDEVAVAQAVEETGHNPWEHKLLGVTAMTKMLGKKTFDEVVGPHLHKPEGKPTLVPESDKRPAITLATPENTFQPLTK